jgi:hypothetical protein
MVTAELAPRVAMKTSAPAVPPVPRLPASDMKATLVPSPLMVGSPLLPSPPAAPAALTSSVWPAPAGSVRA